MTQNLGFEKLTQCYWVLSHVSPLVIADSALGSAKGGKDGWMEGPLIWKALTTRLWDDDDEGDGDGDGRPR